MFRQTKSHATGRVVARIAWPPQERSLGWYGKTIAVVIVRELGIASVEYRGMQATVRRGSIWRGNGIYFRNPVLPPQRPGDERVSSVAPRDNVIAG